MQEQNTTTSAFSRMFTLRHYYGDSVRLLFLLGAVLLFVVAPFLAELNFAAGLGVAGMALLLVLFAGLTSPRQRGVALADAVIAGLGCLFLELVAMQIYAVTGDPSQPFFIAFQLAAFDFLFAFYFSVKTIRSMRAVQASDGGVQ